MSDPAADAAGCRLYLISPPRLDDPDAFVRTLAETLDAGDVACFQLRLKDADDDRLRRHIDLLRPVVQARDVAFIVNDRPDIAAETGCDGVHVGQSDTPYAEARRLVGPNAIVGVSCHNSCHLAMEAADAGADYVAFGAFFPSGTKAVEHQSDLEILRDWSLISTVPCVAIGGITIATCRLLVEAGADFLAVGGGVWRQADGAVAAVTRFRQLLAASPGLEPAR